MRIFCYIKGQVNRSIGIVLMCLFTSVLFAQKIVDRNYTKDYIIFYQLNTSEIDPLFADNCTALDTMEIGLQNLLSLEGVKIDSMFVIASASPDGDSLYNYNLSVKRGESLNKYLLRIFPEFEQRIIQQVPVGENWKALEKMAEEDSEMPYRQVLLDIVNSDFPLEEKEQKLKQHKELYKYICKHYFPKLRFVQIVLNYSSKQLCAFEMKRPYLALFCNTSDCLPIYIPSAARKSGFVFPHFAVRTNLLYDVAMTPNIGLEFFFHDKWSVAVNWMYAWWKNDKKSFYWRVYGGDLEGRWWLGENGYGEKYTGHHLGAYVQAGTFDFELGGKGQMVDHWSFGGGVSYGYALPVARNLNLDFSIGLGYFRGDFKEYKPIDGHYVWQRTKRRNWIGPTKTEISLVWHIGGKKR